MPEDALNVWLGEAADGLVHAIISSCSVIDFECVKIDGWLPVIVRDRLVELVETKLSQYNVKGLSLPEIEPGTVGPDARALGAASLPLSNRFLVDQGSHLLTV